LQAAAGAVQLAPPLAGVNRQADRVALVEYRARAGLPDPPRRTGGELASFRQSNFSTARISPIAPS